MKKLYLILFGLFIFSPYLFAQAEITNRLSEAMLQAQKEGTTLKTVIVLENQYDIQALDKLLYEKKSNLQERAFTVITELHKHAESTQANLLNFLQLKSKEEISDYQNYWITNVVTAETKAEVILELSQRTDISLLDLQDEFKLIEPVEKRPAPKTSPNSAEPGLKVINAHKLWKMGITGEGVIVMNIDNGVDGTHSALTYRWRGNHVPSQYAWFDPAGNSTFPIDPSSGHGTHTMGTITGLDSSTNDTIGVAFNAEWIAARKDWYSQSNFLSIFQWAINPDELPDTYDDMPAVISNSWGWGDDCDMFYKPAIDALEAAGIALVFAAGNDGPASGTVISPVMINTTEMNVFSVGAVNGNNPGLPIASWSSRGPTYCTGLGNQIKPEVSAPGVDVRSCLPNGGYAYWSGTSMAAPHAAGAIALLKQAFPGKTGAELKQMLYETAYDLGSTGEDNTYGMGVIDVYAALLANTSLDNPMPPGNVSIYSDYTTPTSALITWTDAKYSVGGDSLTNFEINFWRDSLFLTSVSNDVQNFTDNSLTNGQKYEYEIITRNLITDSLSSPVNVSVYAGGSPYPSPPSDFTCTFAGDSVILDWLDPAMQTDGTPIDDLAKIYIFRDDVIIDSVLAGVETYSDTTAIPGSAVYYFFLAADNEVPQNSSVSSERIACFIGAAPDFLVWVGQRAIRSTISNADSIFKAIAANGESVFLTNNLFEFGTDLSIFKGIFVVLGVEWDQHILWPSDPEPAALEDYLFNGGRIYLEGGDCFYDASVYGGYNILSWFSLNEGSGGTNDLFGIVGLDYFANFTFDYQGPNLIMDQLEPINSTPIWQNDSTGAICGVWNYGPGIGQAIGVVPSFGGLVDSGHTASNLNFPNQGNLFTENRFAITKPNEPQSTKFVKKYAHNPELKKQHKFFQNKLKFLNNKIQIKANTKNDLMGAYLTLFNSNPPYASNIKLNSTYLKPVLDTLQITSKIANPDTHQVSVQTLIESIDQTYLDSIPMFDDGFHNDSLAGDGIFGGLWQTQPDEESYNIKIHTHSYNLATNHFLNHSTGFTTIGPIILEDFRITSSDTIPHHNDYLKFEFTLRNNGLTATATNITSQIVSLDTFSIINPIVPPDYGNIQPGSTAVGNRRQYIRFDLGTEDSIDVKFGIDISSNGNLFWSDSFFVFVHIDPTGIEITDGNIPKEFALKQNYPNPFNPITNIEFSIPKTEFVTLKIFNILGQEVSTLVSEKLKAGSYNYSWNAGSLASGVYLYKIEAGDPSAGGSGHRFVETRKMILLR